MAVYPSATSTFVHDHEATNKLVVDFARNTREFPLNNYVQVVPMDKPAGYYLEMNVEEAGRVLNTDLKEFIWPDGQDAPDGNWGLEAFEFKHVEAKRYAYPFRMGLETARNASWEIVARHASIKAQQAMTARTLAALTVLTTSGNWPSGHVIDATVPGGGKNWATSTTTDLAIKKSLIAGMEKILDDTLAAVKAEDMVLVVSSELAGDMACSQEIVDYIKGSPAALAQIRGELPGRNVLYGLPDVLYGIPLYVEDTRRVTTLKGATKGVSQVLPAANALLLSRPGGLEGVQGAPSFSTMTVFTRRGYEMRVEQKEDEWNQIVRGRVVDYFTPVLTAPISGVLFTNCTS